jgi:hypothetical protein
MRSVLLAPTDSLPLRATTERDGSAFTGARGSSGAGVSGVEASYSLCMEISSGSQ